MVPTFRETYSFPEREACGVNGVKVAELLRLLADAIEEDTPANDTVRKPRIRKTRGREYPAPLREVSETDRMRAAKMLRRRGIGT